ncbi:MAG TPA: metallophosphoesterase family protein [Gaiellaceae bacterium]|nr:metallophosphoesterase family protein [Gaiellaceae bacterium]
MDVTTAALYDVHGNLPALEAVLAETGGADAVVFGGDLIWGAWPRECLELALSLGDRARFVLGNTDRFVLTATDESSSWVRERLSGEQLELVRAWPLTLELDGVLYCHATPRSDEELVVPVSSEERWAEVLEGVEERVVVCGHTHIQFDEVHAGRRVVNPGSVGNPTDRATAWWALIGPEIELRTTDYDTVATAAAMRATGFPRTDFADELIEVWTRESVYERFGDGS